MIKDKRKIIITGILILILIILNSSALATIEANITVNPTEPAPLSKITFTAQITGENITDVKLYVQECSSSLCFPEWLNKTMIPISLGKYQGDITLIHSNTVYINYWLVVTADGNVYNLQDQKETLNLKINSNNGNNGKKSPGFEFVVLILGIILLTFILKKKRLK